MLPEGPKTVAGAPAIAFVFQPVGRSIPLNLLYLNSLIVLSLTFIPYNSTGHELI